MNLFNGCQENVNTPAEGFCKVAVSWNLNHCCLPLVRGTVEETEKKIYNHDNLTHVTLLKYDA